MKRPRLRPPMRTLLVVLLLLVAGAIVNVAVAWAHPYILPTTGVADRPWRVSVRLQYELGTGLPMRAMTWTTDGHLAPNAIILPGFAINTLFYAAIIWGAFVASSAMRRRERIEQGLCPKCAYDLRGCASQNCPECGNPVTASGVEHAS